MCALKTRAEHFFYFVSRKRDQRTLLADRLTPHMLYFNFSIHFFFKECIYLFIYFWVGLAETWALWNLPETLTWAAWHQRVIPPPPLFRSDWYIMRCVCSRRAIVKVFLSGTNSAHHMISTVEWLSCVFPSAPCGSNIWLFFPPLPNFRVLLYLTMINKHTHIPRAILNAPNLC